MQRESAQGRRDQERSQDKPGRNPVAAFPVPSLQRTTTTTTTTTTRLRLEDVLGQAISALVAMVSASALAAGLLLLRWVFSVSAWP